MSAILRSLPAAVAILAGMVTAAVAQSPRCDAWRAELAQIERGGARVGNPNAERALQQVGAQLGRAQAAYASLQCDGAWVFQAPPPQCGPLRGQIGQLRAQFASLQQQTGGGVDNRRRALMAALNDNCRPGIYSTQPIAPIQPQQPRTLFEALFGVQPEPQRPQGGMPEINGEIFDPPPDDRFPSWGAGRPVCVRTCDGFFFPLGNSPGGRETQSDMCQALCPATETRVFYMPGDGNIENATTRSGERYTSLANASRYTRQYDPACTCRKAGQSWAAALSEAEEMIERRRGDILVNERRAEEMSRARVDPRLRQRQEAALRNEAVADAATQQALEAQGRSAPTAGTETTGIAAGQVGAGFVAAGQGERREIVSPGGERRTVRVVAPNLAPAIQ